MWDALRSHSPHTSDGKGIAERDCVRATDQSQRLRQPGRVRMNSRRVELRMVLRRVRWTQPRGGRVRTATVRAMATLGRLSDGIPLEFKNGWSSLLSAWSQCQWDGPAGRPHIRAAW